MDSFATGRRICLRVPQSDHCRIGLIVADALASLTHRRRHRHHDDAQGHHGQSDKFENQSFHGNISRQAARLAGQD
jgi:hypothetical protein